MDILFINPPQSRPRDQGYLYPLGIASIISCLEQNSYSPAFLELIDFLDGEDGWERIKKTMSGRSPDIIGITSFSDNRIHALNLARLSKEMYPDAMVVMGGTHATFMYSQILQRYPVDAVVIGEGEVTFLELVEAVAGQIPLKSVNGIAFQDRDGQVRKTPPRALIPDLDSLPMHAYHHFDMSRDSYIPVVFSRGCPFNCHFCAESGFWNKSFRTRSIEKCVDELEYLANNCNFRNIDIYDSILSIDSRRVEELCREIIRRNLRIRWGARLRVDNVTPETLNWLVKAGCDGILFGVESGSEKILKNINKKSSVEKIVQGFDLAHDAGLKPRASTMVGNPGECFGTVWQTDRVLKRIKPHRTFVIPAKVYPGTQLYETARQKGIVKDEDWLTDKPVPRYTESMSEAKLFFFAGLLRKNQFPCSDSKARPSGATVYARQTVSLLSSPLTLIKRLLSSE